MPPSNVGICRYPRGSPERLLLPAQASSRSIKRNAGLINQANTLTLDIQRNPTAFRS
jgi:hypothetical protein